jgi:hypothetical protein
VNVPVGRTLPVSLLAQVILYEPAPKASRSEGAETQHQPCVLLLKDINQPGMQGVLHGELHPCVSFLTHCCNRSVIDPTLWGCSTSRHTMNSAPPIMIARRALRIADDEGYAAQEHVLMPGIA